MSATICACGLPVASARTLAMFFLIASDYYGDVIGRHPVCDLFPRLRFPTLPRSEGLRGHHNVRHPVTDHSFDEARQVGL